MRTRLLEISVGPFKKTQATSPRLMTFYQCTGFAKVFPYVNLLPVAKGAESRNVKSARPFTPSIEGDAAQTEANFRERNAYAGLSPFKGCEAINKQFGIKSRRR
jgi:hypothetical protein